jgi:hypothetical protein
LGGLDTVRRDVDHTAHALQHRHADELIGAIVFGQKYA